MDFEPDTWVLPEGATKLETPEMDPAVDPKAPHLEAPGKEQEEEEKEERPDGDLQKEDEGWEEEEESEERPKRSSDPDAEMEEDPSKSGEEKAEEEEKRKMRTRTFKLLTPLKARTAEEVTKATMQMILRLRADGYHVGRIHSDQGHEFMGNFKRWATLRGIHLSRTSGDDYKANGRCEAVVKALKSFIRRQLLQAEVGQEWWAWAARYTNELCRTERTDIVPSWPPFLEEVWVRKRKWRQGTFETSMEKVKYLAPAPDEHGHWVVGEGERPRITKLLIKKGKTPTDEEGWHALEREVRYRRKGPHLRDVLKWNSDKTLEKRRGPLLRRMFGYTKPLGKRRGPL